MNETSELRRGQEASMISSRAFAVFATPRPFPQPRAGAGSL